MDTGPNGPRPDQETNFALKQEQAHQATEVFFTDLIANIIDQITPADQSRIEKVLLEGKETIKNLIQDADPAPKDIKKIKQDNLFSFKLAFNNIPRQPDGLRQRVIDFAFKIFDALYPENK
jgi:hypothetical protein